jgi:predicted Zn-dependent peptidase
MQKKSFVFFLAAVLAVSLASQAFATKRPHPSELEYDPIKITMPEITEMSLSNGMECIFIEDHEIPVVDVVLLVKTYFPDKEKYGLNEMAAWVMRNGGTETWPGDKLNDELEFLAAGIEVYGRNLSTVLSFNCLKKDLPQVLEMFADVVMNPAFPEEKIEMKRGTMLEDIRRKNDEPGPVSRREYAKLIYRDHPYSWEETTESVSAVTREDLAAFHSKYFHPDNSIIGISGDVTKDEITEALEGAFAGWERGDVAIPEVPDIPVEPSPSVSYAYMDINQAHIRIGHLGINSSDPDRCAVNIMDFILGSGSFTSWIIEKVRADEGLAYSAGTSYSSDPWVKGMFTASAQTKAESCSRAITLMADLIKRMKETGPTEEEVKKAVDSYVNGQVFDYESKSQLVQRLVSLRYQGRPLDTPQKDMETYAKLTVDDVREAARKHLHPDKLTMLVVGDAELFDRPLSDFGEVKEIELEAE